MSMNKSVCSTEAAMVCAHFICKHIFVQGDKCRLSQVASGVLTCSHILVHMAHMEKSPVFMEFEVDIVFSTTSRTLLIWIFLALILGFLFPLHRDVPVVHTCRGHLHSLVDIS